LTLRVTIVHTYQQVPEHFFRDHEAPLQVTSAAGVKLDASEDVITLEVLLDGIGELAPPPLVDLVTAAAESLDRPFNEPFHGVRDFLVRNLGAEYHHQLVAMQDISSAKAKRPGSHSRLELRASVVPIPATISIGRPHWYVKRLSRAGGRARGR
jgi:hypothetical protein